MTKVVEGGQSWKNLTFADEGATVKVESKFLMIEEGIID